MDIFSIPIRGIFCQKTSQGHMNSTTDAEKEHRSQIKRLSDLPLYVSAWICYLSRQTPGSVDMYQPTALIPSLRGNLLESSRQRSKEASTPMQHLYWLSSLDSLPACSFFRPVSSETRLLL